MTKKIQSNLAIVAVILGILGFGYFKYLVTPLDAKFNDGLKKLQQVEAKLDDTKRKSLELPALQASMKALETEVSGLEKLLPKDKEIPNLLRTVTRTAQKYQIKIANITPGTVAGEANYNEIPFQMNMQGTFHAIAYFILDIGQEPRILSIRNISFTSNSATKENNSTVNITCTFLAYTFKS